MTVPVMDPPLRATNQLVIITWIASIPGFSRGMVDKTLPPTVNPDGSPAAWTSPGGGIGFVTVTVAGGSPGDLVPWRKPVAMIDCYDTVPGSNEPPWNTANWLAETIIAASYRFQQVPRPLIPVDNDVTYPTAVVAAATPLTEPRPVYDDAGDFARYTLDVQFVWKQLEHIP